MEDTFSKFLETFLNVWRDSSITELEKIISKDYKAREISKGEVLDFGFEESILGWEQGFNFVKENNAQWELGELSILPLRDDEVLVIISASMIIDGNSLETANIFFDTFKKDDAGQWKMVRSYVEAGVPKENINKMQFRS